MDQTKFLLQNQYQRITYDTVLTAIGDLARRNLETIMRTVGVDRHAVFMSKFALNAGMVFDITPGLFVYRTDADNVAVAVLAANEPVTIPTQIAVDRIDLIEAQYSLTDGDPVSVDVIDPVTGIVTATTLNTAKIPTLTFKILGGVPDSGVALPVEAGYFKVGEIYIRAGAASLAIGDLRDVDDCAKWTEDFAATIRMKSLKDQKSTARQFAFLGG